MLRILVAEVCHALGVTAGKASSSAERAPRQRLLLASLNVGAGAVGLITYAVLDGPAMFLVCGIGFMVFGAADLVPAIIKRRVRFRPHDR